MKSKPPKEILKRREEQPSKKHQPPPKGTSVWKRLEWAIGSTVAIAGLLLTALQFQARPVMSLGAPLDPRGALTTPITIYNEGLTDLNDIQFESYFRVLEFGSGNKIGDFSGRSALTNITTLTARLRQEAAGDIEKLYDEADKKYHFHEKPNRQ